MRPNPSSWKVTIYPLPRGFYGARCGGFLNEGVCGTVESAGNRLVGCVWVGGEIIKVEGGKGGDTSFLASSGHLIVGSMRPKKGTARAAAWTLLRESVAEVPLNTSRFRTSLARACEGDLVGGYGQIEGQTPRATIWKAGEPTQLSSESGVVLGLRDGFMVGAAVGWPPKALFWLDQGEPVMLADEQFTATSALGVGGGEQVGFAARDEATWLNGLTKPVVWHGSSDSIIDLLPDGFDAGEATDCSGGIQVGWVRAGNRTTGVVRAGLWTGSRESFFDLHQIIGGDWTDSAARRVLIAGSRLSILGEVKLMSPDRRGIAAEQIVRWDAILTP